MQCEADCVGASSALAPNERSAIEAANACVVDKPAVCCTALSLISLNSGMVGPSPHMLSSCGTAKDDACRDVCSGRNSRNEFLSMQSFDTVGPSPHMLSSCGIAREDACRDTYAGLFASKEEVFLRHFSTPDTLGFTERAWQTECIDVAIQTSYDIICFRD